MDNCFKSIEKIEAELDGICPRCCKKDFEKRGDHMLSKLVCNTCGLKIKVTTRYNENIYVILALLMLAGLGVVAWISFLMKMAVVV